MKAFKIINESSGCYIFINCIEWNNVKNIIKLLNNLAYAWD